MTEQQKGVADIDGNGKISNIDYMMLKRYCLSTYVIKQNRTITEQ